MQLWVGLGNPGPQYAMNRHNVGFMVVDTLADFHSFGPVQKKFQGWLQEGRIGGQKILLLKPATFMNESGRAVGEALRFYKLGTDALTVFHDELDLAPFKVKLKHGGGTAGHNGLKDVQVRLTTPDFWRLRIGVGHPRTLQLAQEVADFVLHPPSREHQQAIHDAMGRALEIVPQLVEGQFERAMMQLHRAP